MRLFIAIEPEAEVKAYLESVQHRLIKQMPDISPAKSFHLTLRFLGEVSEDKLGPLKGVLDNLSFPAFTLSTAGLGVFPDMRRPKVIWAGVEPEKPLRELHSMLDICLADAGFLRDKKPYQPHFTLARIKIIARDTSRKVASSIEDAQTKRVGFRAGSVILFKSTLTSKGPVYENLYQKEAVA